MMGYYGMEGFSFLGMMFMFVFWIAFIWLIVWMVSQVNVNKNISSSNDSKEILKERYVKGEITKKEYKNMLNTIEK